MSIQGYMQTCKHAMLCIKIIHKSKVNECKVIKNKKNTSTYALVSLSASDALPEPCVSTVIFGPVYHLRANKM